MNKSNPEILMVGAPIGFCYLLAVNGHQKIGHSMNVDGVLSNARRFDASARLLTCWVTHCHVEGEKILHEGLKKWRIENEQFQLPPEVVQWLASLDDHEYSNWVDEGDGDPRTIGYDFPRMYYSGKRIWRCVFYPKSDSFAWTRFIGYLKPDYSVLERLWAQDSRAFQTVSLGVPASFVAANF